MNENDDLTDYEKIKIEHELKDNAEKRRQMIDYYNLKELQMPTQKIDLKKFYNALDKVFKNEK